MISLRRIEICNKATVIVYSAASSNTNSSAVACVLCYLEMSLRKKSRHIAILQMYTWTHVQRRSLHYAQQAGHAGKSWKRLNVKQKVGDFFFTAENVLHNFAPSNVDFRHLHKLLVYFFLKDSYSVALSSVRHAYVSSEIFQVFFC